MGGRCRGAQCQDGLAANQDEARSNDTLLGGCPPALLPEARGRGPVRWSPLGWHRRCCPCYSGPYTRGRGGTGESQRLHRMKDKVQDRGVRSLGGSIDRSGGWHGALANDAGMAARGGRRNRGRRPNRTGDGGEVESGLSSRSFRDGDGGGASRHARQGALGHGATAGLTRHFFRETAMAPR
jgi:hypothetical protein